MISLIAIDRHKQDLHADILKRYSNFLTFDLSENDIQNKSIMHKYISYLTAVFFRRFLNFINVFFKMASSLTKKN